MTWLLTLSAALAAEPLPLAGACHPLGDMPGPEDFDVFDLEGQPSFIVGGDDRRQEEFTEASGFYAVAWPSGASERLAVQGRDACALRPHGVSVFREADGWRLGAVMHYDDADLEREGCALPEGPDGPLTDAVELFRVQGRTLVFEQRLAAPAFTDPNELDLGPGGRFAVSNNPQWSVPKFLLQRTLRRGPSQVWAYDPEGGWSLALDDVLYANGVLLLDDRLLVGTYFGALVDPAGGEAQLGGALDNILVDEAGVIWVTGHHEPMDFIQHTRDGAHPSPTLTHALSPEGEPLGTWLTPPDAKAASTALRMQDEEGRPWMVYAQVYERGLVACPLGELVALPALPAPPPAPVDVPGAEDALDADSAPEAPAASPTEADEAEQEAEPGE
ncbi:MAG: hypothetical protein H6741_28565 [Alphaproteobacteria bacterium]|nr:hypothetical protein [Alphaproteobacteria bacterium]MCB9796671.1 hypothetical protein [Alphaproteobacteria bacterium]